MDTSKEGKLGKALSAVGTVILVTIVVLILRAGVRAMDERPVCMKWSDRHFLVGGERYVMMEGISCGKLEGAMEVKEESCFLERELGSMKIKTFVDCPENQIQDPTW